MSRALARSTSLLMSEVLRAAFLMSVLAFGGNALGANAAPGSPTVTRDQDRPAPSTNGTASADSRGRVAVEDQARIPTTGNPGGAEEQFHQAGAAYEAGRYEEAAAIYDSLLKEGYDDARLHYNLGNVRFKQGRLGPAILCYERALERNPSDPDAKENLAYAALLITDKVGTLEEELPARLLARLEQQFGVERALGLLAILSLLGGALAVPLWFSPSLALRRVLRALVGVAIGGAILVAWVAAIEIAHPGGGAYAVVLAASVDGRSAPASDGTVLFTVHEGLKVEVRSERSGWVQITLPNGLAGWIDATALERI